MWRIKMNKNDFIMRPLITNIGKEIGESIFVLSKIDGFDLPYMMICRVGFSLYHSIQP